MSFYTDCRLYLISPPAFALEDFAETLKNTLKAGDVAAFQLRLKKSDESAIIDAIKTLMPICHAHDVAFILNDSHALAAKQGCDGAHIGKDDGAVTTARKTLGNNRSLGVSCYNSSHTAMLAAESGADYVAFGSFYPTVTKETATPADIDTLRNWCAMSVVPACAIGGITIENATPLITAGANFLAVSSGIWQYKDGAAAAVTAYNKVIQEQQK
jgi:thiamine-phosphate pyrophosphorylase